MSGVRMLIWTPLNAAELQKAMHGASVGPAALVPVQSGTVLLPSPNTRPVDAMAVALKIRKVTGNGSVVAVWSEDGAIVYTAGATVARGWSWGAHEPLRRLNVEANQYGWFGRWYDRAFSRFSSRRDKETWQASQVQRYVFAVPRADRDAVSGIVRDYLDATGVVPRLFRAFNLPEVAQVAELVDQGRADTWLEPLAAPRLSKGLERLYFWPALVVLALVVLTSLSLWLKLLLLMVPLAMYYGITAVAAKQRVGKKPINTVLPVIPVTQGAAPTE